MTLRAEVLKGAVAGRWCWDIYDTGRPTAVIDYGQAERGEWATALLDAQSALQRLHLKALQDRVNETVRKLADVYPMYRVTVGLGPEPKTWEGDYA